MKLGLRQHCRLPLGVSRRVLRLTLILGDISNALHIYLLLTLTSAVNLQFNAKSHPKLLLVPLAIKNPKQSPDPRRPPQNLLAPNNNDLPKGQDLA